MLRPPSFIPFHGLRTIQTMRRTKNHDRVLGHADGHEAIRDFIAWWNGQEPLAFDAASKATGIAPAPRRAA